jgi:hypothetical protein
MATLPIEILDLIVDAAVEGSSSRTVFGVTFTPELVKLLKDIALISHHLRKRAQRYLFQEIRLRPSVLLDKHNEIAAAERSLSIFEDNPRLLEYSRSLAIVDPRHAGVKPSLSPHFVSVLFPFFANNLRNLHHLSFATKGHYYYDWTATPSEFQDSLIRCISSNSLKSLMIHQFGLPREFVGVLPPTLEALDIASDGRADPEFTAKYINQGSKHPADLSIRSTGRPGWFVNQGPEFFSRVKSLEINGMIIAYLAIFLRRSAAHTLTHLSLRHQEHVSGRSSHAPPVDKFKSLMKLYITGFQAKRAISRWVNLPFMPCLEELKVSITATPNLPIACPAEAVTLAGGYIVPGFRRIHTFRLRIEWKSSQRSPAGRFLPEETRDAFGRLDTLLSDRGLLENLKEVEIDLRPVDVGDGHLENELAGGLRSKTCSEVLEGLHRTVERVGIFSATMSNSFA